MEVFPASAMRRVGHTQTVVATTLVLVREAQVKKIAFVKKWYI